MSEKEDIMNLQNQIVENLDNVVNNTTNSIKNLQNNINYVNNTLIKNWVDYNLNILLNIFNTGSYWDVTYYEKNGDITNYNNNYFIVLESKINRNYLTLNCDWYTDIGKTNVTSLYYSGGRQHRFDSNDVYLGKKFGKSGNVHNTRITVRSPTKVEVLGYVKMSNTLPNIYNITYIKKNN